MPRYPLRPGEKRDRHKRIICVHGERRMHCTICKQARRKRWIERNPDSHLRSSLAQLGIGVTIEWYRQKEKEQKGLCAICGKPETAKRNGKLMRLAVDHNHDESKHPRGLLCNRCNFNLSVLEDLDWCAKAQRYITSQGF
jgi:Recombination endonuclease VII